MDRDQMISIADRVISDALDAWTPADISTAIIDALQKAGALATEMTVREVQNRVTAAALALRAKGKEHAYVSFTVAIAQHHKAAYIHCGAYTGRTMTGGLKLSA